MPHLVVGTAGHIDHGKSTLVHALTGIDPDRLKEEKARGITIDLGFAHWQQGDVTVAFVDVPGHERFVKNMLAGVGGMDAVMLVIAADEGVMPQTREHFDICRLLAVPRGIVAITKADTVDAETIEIVGLEIADLVKGSALEPAPVVAVSAHTGQGIETLRGELLSLAGQVTARDAGGPVRLPIDRVFSMRGFGTVVTGTLGSGTLQAEADVEAVPGGRRVKVRGVQVHGASQPRASAGQRVALNLAGVDVGDLARGQVLATPGTLRATQLVDATLQLLPAARPLRHNARVRFHHGTAETLARVSIVAAPPDTGVLTVTPGSAACVRLRFEKPAALARGDRFVVRSYSPAITIAGGQVLDVKPPHGGVRLAATLERFAQLQAPFTAGTPESDALLVFVRESRAFGIQIAELTARSSAQHANASAAQVEARADVWRVGDRLLLASWREVLGKRVRSALAAHHELEPLSEGLPREEMRERLLADASGPVADAVLRDLAAAGDVVGRERLRLAGHEVRLSGQEAEAEAALLAAYRAAGLMPPDQDAVARATGLTPPVVQRVTHLLLRQKVLVKVDALIFHHESLERLKADIASLKSEKSPAQVNVATFKDRFGLTRKYAIPLLEYLDRERVTRRVGESRMVL